MTMTKMVEPSIGDVICRTCYFEDNKVVAVEKDNGLDVCSECVDHNVCEINGIAHLCAESVLVYSLDWLSFSEEDAINAIMRENGTSVVSKVVIE